MDSFSPPLPIHQKRPFAIFSCLAPTRAPFLECFRFQVTALQPVSAFSFFNNASWYSSLENDMDPERIHLKFQPQVCGSGAVSMCLRLHFGSERKGESLVSIILFKHSLSDCRLLRLSASPFWPLSSITIVSSSGYLHRLKIDRFGASCQGVPKISKWGNLLERGIFVLTGVI